MTASDEFTQRWEQSMMDNYGTPGTLLTGGSGCVVTDVDGVEYLDLLSGIAVNALGHAHPAVCEAVADQIGRLGHVSNLYAHEPGLRLAERLLEVAGLSGRGRVMFCNSGGEANEAAFKIARLTGRQKVIATNGGFHGRTMGALALTGQPGKQAPFAPLPGGVQHIDYGDADVLESAVDEDTAAVFLEPLQGENGVVVPPVDYLRRAREITERHGALLVLDEVQTGVGRTGAWFAFQDAGMTPDVITTAKGLGGGLPMAACIGVGHAAELLRPGQHATTFGGNPVAARAALAVLDTIERDGLLAHVRETGRYLRDGLRGLEHPLVREVRGAGLLIGIGLRESAAAQAVDAARAAGYLINGVKPDVLRLAPPLIIDKSQVDTLLSDLPAILDKLEVHS